MCGIAGYISIDPSSDIDLDFMVDRLRHRGPDEKGHVCIDGLGLGAARLTIVGGDSGKQPALRLGHDDRLVLNGEIYNWSELGGADDTSDSHVALDVLRTSGVAGLAEFRGGFALAYLDPSSESILLARDQFGQKPLYYREVEEGVLFASEPYVLFRTGESPVIDEDVLASLLRFQFLPPGVSLFAGVRSLPPGAWLEFKRDSKTGGISKQTGQIPWPSKGTEKTASLFSQSCARQKELNQSSCLMLSGGLDSTAVLGGLAAAGQVPDAAFVGYFPDGPETWDERPYAREAAEVHGVKLTEVAITPELFAEAMMEACCALGEPIAGPGATSQFILCREAAAKHKLVYGGQGGDELFGGYARLRILQILTDFWGDDHDPAYDSLYQRMSEEAERCPMDSLAPYRAAVDRGQALLEFATPRTGRLLTQAASIESCLVGDTFDSVLSAALEFEWRVLLPGLLQVDDRCCSAFGMEGRSPFLDQDLASHLLAMPLPLKSPPTRPRKLFLEELSSLLPASIAARTDKLGFPHPLLTWWRGSLQGWGREQLSLLASRDNPLIEVERIEALLENDGQGGRLVYFLIMLELWQQNFIDQPVPSKKCWPRERRFAVEEEVEES
jgi:asparagine synthase (glutamine-hydrolysing)